MTKHTVDSIIWNLWDNTTLHSKYLAALLLVYVHDFPRRVF